MLKLKLMCATLTALAAVTLATSQAQALSQNECDRLAASQFLAAIERGACNVDIQTAAGPTAEDSAHPGEPGEEERTGRGESGGGDSGGGDSGGGGNPGGGTRAGASPGAKP